MHSMFKIKTGMGSMQKREILLDYYKRITENVNDIMSHYSGIAS